MDPKLIQTYKDYIIFEDDPLFQSQKIVKFKENGVIIGELVKAIDGYWDFYPKELNAFSDFILISIGINLFDLNQPINLEITKQLEEIGKLQKIQDEVEAKEMEQAIKNITQQKGKDLF